MDINGWCTNIKLTFYTGKCKAITIGNNKAFCGLLKPIKFGDNTYAHITKSRCLGIIINSQLSWHSHVQSLRLQIFWKQGQPANKTIKGVYQCQLLTLSKQYISDQDAFSATSSKSISDLYTGCMLTYYQLRFQICLASAYLVNICHIPNRNDFAVPQYCFNLGRT